MGIRIPQSNFLSSVADEAITKDMHDGLGRATTTASSLEAEQGSGNIFKTQTKATPSRPSSPRTSLEGGPWCHVTMRGSSVQARPERLSNLPNEPPLGEGNTSRSREGSMKLLELMDICTKLSSKATTLENELSSTKAIHNKALITLTKRVKKLEKKLKLKRRSEVVDSLENEEASLHNKDSSKQGRMIEEIDKDEKVNLVKSSKQWEAHDTVWLRMESDDTKVVDFSTASPLNDDDEVTLAETLVNIKISATKDKGKAIMQESEPPKKLKKKEMIQIGHDEELAQKLHVEELVKDIARQEQERYDFEKALELQKQLDEREKVFRTVEEEIVQQDDVVSKQIMKESSRKDEGRLKRKTSKARKDKEKRQKNQDDPEKLTLVEYVEVIYDSEEIHRADGSYKTYMFFSEMLNDFDREDLIVLYKLFNEKYASTRPGFDDLMLWGDMKIMVEPNDDDAVWKNHPSQELIE
ncbi:hypothetical protein Tco_0813031 [Tanacetum coccineum]